MGRPTNPNSLSTRHRIELAGARIERQILSRSLAEVIPLVRQGILDVELGLVVGVNGGLREIEFGDIRHASTRLTVNLPVEWLAPGRVAPALVDAMVDTLAEIRAAA